MRLRHLDRELWIKRPLEEVFEFFSDAANLELLTPPWMSFQILTPRPIAMRTGTIIDYKLRVRGLPMRWRSEITVWDPPHRFVDEQLRGPYRHWHHDHVFESRDGGTLCRDILTYAVPFDFFAHRLFVRRELETIFDFRHRAMKQRFESAA